MTRGISGNRTARLAVLLAAATAACAPASTANDPDWAPGICNLHRRSDLAGLIRLPYNDEVRATALERTGARDARIIRPGDAVTQDMRRDRLNIYLAADDKVERFSCG